MFFVSELKVTGMVDFEGFTDLFKSLPTKVTDIHCAHTLDKGKWELSAVVLCKNHAFLN